VEAPDHGRGDPLPSPLARIDPPPLTKTDPPTAVGDTVGWLRDALALVACSGGSGPASLSGSRPRELARFGGVTQKAARAGARAIVGPPGDTCVADACRARHAHRPRRCWGAGVRRYWSSVLWSLSFSAHPRPRAAAHDALARARAGSQCTSGNRGRLSLDEAR